VSEFRDVERIVPVIRITIRNVLVASETIVPTLRSWHKWDLSDRRFSSLPRLRAMSKRCPLTE